MRIVRRSHRWVFLAIAAVLAAESARAGINTWTGVGSTASLFATDPRDPYLVYAVFYPGDLVRSVDGGRTWTHLATFDAIYALLVHPASPDTLYVSAADFRNQYSNLLKSSDRGQTWTRTPASIYYDFFTVLVGSATDPGLVWAAAGGRLYRSTDGAAHWLPTGTLAAAIASLVIHPHDPSLLYAGGDSDSYYYPFGAFAQSTNTGGNWTYASSLGLLDHVRVALDANPSTLFVGLASGSVTGERGVRRSDDGGATWVHAENGLPHGTQVETIAADPVNSGTVYAGTAGGIYRSRDSGATWLPFSQRLEHVGFNSLMLSPDGRTLLATTDRGGFAFELSEGPIDVAATGGGAASGVLSWNADRLSVQTLSGSGTWSASPFEGPVEAWHAVAAASSGDGRTRVLWQAGDGRSALETVGAGGRESAVVFAASSWMPVDLSVGSDGNTRLLLASAEGAMYVASVDASGSVSSRPQYGPTGDWRAIALADASDGGTWVLWRSPDGRSAVSIHSDGVMVASARFEASPDGTVVDLAVGADGKARILVADAAGAARVWTVAADGTRSSGDALQVTGLLPRRIAAAADGGIRVLWTDRSGRGAVSVLSAAGAVVATHDVPPLP
jgi:photosystem II stability/assembly factor-like uncharacterized protein